MVCMPKRTREEPLDRKRVDREEVVCTLRFVTATKKARSCGKVSPQSLIWPGTFGTRHILGLKYLIAWVSRLSLRVRVDSQADELPTIKPPCSTTVPLP